MKRRLTVGVLALIIFAAGCYGSWSYATDYYVYRGFPVLHDPVGIPRGRVVTLNVSSKSLHARRTVLVYLPPHYFRGARHRHRYPVLYLLQASVGQATNYLKAGGLGPRIDELVNQGRIPPYITVMPGGHGPDHEWANAQAGNFEGYVLDVVHAIDSRFSTIANRRGRIIAGLSEGGYGAANIALRHLPMFSAFESWSGYYVQPGGFPFVGPSLGKIAANSPALYVPTLRAQLHRLPLRAFMYQGYREHPGVQVMLGFARELRANGARAVDTGYYPGGHNWGLWRAHFSHMLLWAGQRFPK